MSLTFIRRPSATPTVESKDDVRIFRRLYAGQNGYIKNYGNGMLRHRRNGHANN